MDIASPREKVLKTIRRNLMVFQRQQVRVDSTTNLYNPPNWQNIDFCNNKYHFTDKLLVFLETKNIKSCYCNHQPTKNYLENCGYKLENGPENASALLLNVDVFDALSQSISFLDNDLQLSLSEQQGVQVFFFAFKDQVADSSQVAYQRLAGRLKNNSDATTLHLRRRKNEPEIPFYIINQR